MIFHLNSIHEKPEIFPIQKKKKIAVFSMTYCLNNIFIHNNC